MPATTSPYTIDPNADYNQQISSLLANEPKNRENYLSNLRNQYSYQDRMNRLEGIRKNVASTDQMLQNLPEQLKQRTSGRLMTQGQLSRLQSTETEPLAKTLAQLASSQNTEQAGLNDINSLISQAMTQRGQDVSNIYGELSNLRQQKLTKDEAEAQRRFQAQQQAISNAQARQNLKYQSDLEMQKAQAIADLNKANNPVPTFEDALYSAPVGWVNNLKGEPTQVRVFPSTSANVKELKAQGATPVFSSKGNPDPNYQLGSGDVYKLQDGTLVYLVGRQ